ncbi:uncharacterized protein LOC131590404 isoform X3 [Poecile atricapillus]|uniref:uncharacterized protein LOC131590404 isoform X3 n=1 Tax=Poecile atricapillus TaxID=48891 RepID=UPI0027383533|nr:uncharacterized protein LOC131590404 isoform X3 [Poecile atricapillus]XP_058716434.1 uncharacterized protein LOC131590404 isoform X3 [Poecile atricapillus]XP_058716435.1 uncharacterized protein LOC131590404 isoform X3 [Poecile atricapillus]
MPQHPRIPKSQIPKFQDFRHWERFIPQPFPAALPGSSSRKRSPPSTPISRSRQIPNPKIPKPQTSQIPMTQNPKIPTLQNPKIPGFQALGTFHSTTISCRSSRSLLKETIAAVHADIPIPPNPKSRDSNIPKSQYPNAPTSQNPGISGTGNASFHNHFLPLFPVAPQGNHRRRPRRYPDPAKSQIPGFQHPKIPESRDSRISGAGHALLDDDFLPPRARRCGGAVAAPRHGGGAGQPVRGDVFAVRLADDAEGAGVGVGDVGDGIPNPRTPNIPNPKIPMPQHPKIPGFQALGMFRLMMKFLLFGMGTPQRNHRCG